MGSIIKKPEKKLILILGGLCLLIICLVVGIAVVSNLPKGEESGMIVFGEDKTATDCSNIDKLDDSPSIINCLGYQYGHDDKDGALQAFQRKIDSSFDEGKYDLALELIAGRSTMFYLNDECDKAIGPLDDNRINLASSFAKYDYYLNAADIASSCSDDEKAEYYEKLAESSVGGEVFYGQ